MRSHDACGPCIIRFNYRPDAIKQTDSKGNTALHLVLKARNRRAEAVVAVFEAWPDAVQEKNDDGSVPLKFAFQLNALKDGMYYHPAADADADGAFARNTEVQLTLLAAWPDAAIELDQQGNSMVYAALQMHTHEAVVLKLLDLWPDAAKIVDSGGHTLLALAIKLNAPAAVVRAIIKATPRGERRKKLKIVHREYANSVPFGGGTLFHALAANGCNEGQVTLMHQKLKNEVCFVLAAAGTSVTDVDVQGWTAAADHVRTTRDPRTPFEVHGTSTPKDELINHHLLASLREVASFQASPRLGMEHLRDWTTVSHAWCTPSAKLTALTVLLAGETYKRQILPRLPMDCWYRVLNMIPRYELRLGGCRKQEEDGALKEYNGILGAAANAKQKSTWRAMKGHNLRGR